MINDPRMTDSARRRIRYCIRKMEATGWAFTSSYVAPRGSGYVCVMAFRDKPFGITSKWTSRRVEW